MSYLGSWKIDDPMTFYANTHRFDTGAATDADVVPFYRVYEDETATPLITGSMALLDGSNTVGFYSEQVTLSAANGFEKGKQYGLYIEGTVNSVLGTTHHTFQIEAEVDANTVSGVVGTVTNVTNPVTANDPTGTVNANMIQISGDTPAANNLESDYDGTGYAKTNSTIGTLTTYTGNTPQTGDNFARLGAPAGASVSADIAANQTDLDSILARIGAFTTGGVNTILGFFQALMRSDATTPSDVGGTYDDATDSLQAIRDRGDAAWITGAGGSDRLLMVDTTIATLASQTSFTLTAGSSDDDAYVNCTIVIEDASTSTQKAVGLISDYTGSTKTVTLKYDPAIFTMAATDKVYILAENSLKSTDQNRQLDVTVTGAAGIDWSNIENPTTAVDLSGTDIQLVDTTTTNSDMRGTDGASTHSAADVWSVATRLLTAGTNIVLAKGVGLTGLNDLSAAQVNSEVVDALATDTYAEPGQEAPASTTTLANKINYIYKALRNRYTQTATEFKLYADDTTTVDQKATVSDDGTTFDRGEIGTGP